MKFHFYSLVLISSELKLRKQLINLKITPLLYFDKHR